MKLFSKTPDDLKTALGQCFWIGLNGTTIHDSATKEIFETFQPGGVILFARNVESFEQVRKLNADLQKISSIPLLIAVDQEGGNVERLWRQIGSIPPAMALSAARNKRLIRRIHGAHARLLRALNFNVNFTPVLDLALSNSDNGLGTRCFSDDPRIVAQCAAEVIRAHHNAGVLTCGKHFPGLGDTDTDSHLVLPTVPRAWKQIVKEDLKPYKKLLKDLPLIMVNHALYPEMDPKLPASLSRHITNEFLLKKMNYAGLAISDDLIMGAVSNLYNVPEAAERAIEAGNHMFLICVPEGVTNAYDRLLARAKRDSGLAASIFHNSSRILSFKYRHLPRELLAINARKEIDILRKSSDILAQRAVTRLSGDVRPDLPDSCTLYLPEGRWLEGKPSGIKEYLESRGSSVTRLDFPVQLEQEQAKSLAKASKSSCNIIVAMNASLNPGQQVLMRELLAMKKEVIAIQSGFPIDQAPLRIRSGVATYWRSPAALEAAAKVLFGGKKATGKLPLRAALR
jgi:beta-N-acetylhexosaminidase